MRVNSLHLLILILMMMVLESENVLIALEYEIHNKLGPKIKKQSEPRAPDDEQFFRVIIVVIPFRIHETHFDSKIKDSVETTSNPFDNDSTFLSTDSRTTQRMNAKKRKRRFSHFQEH